MKILSEKSDGRTRWGQALLTAALFFVLTSATAGADQCTLPNPIPVPAPVKVDWKNDNATDYYALVLSWSPQFCATSGQGEKGKFQCRDNHFEFVVHGLWPQSATAKNYQEHPRNCKKSDSLPKDLLKENLCVMPGVDLMQGEWTKHGTCAFNNPKEYLTKIHTLWDTLHKPELDQLAKAGKIKTAGDVKQAMVAANPGLTKEELSVTVGKNNYFSELWVCYDKSFTPQSCPAHSGTPDQQAIKIRPVGR